MVQKLYLGKLLMKLNLISKIYNNKKERWCAC